MNQMLFALGAGALLVIAAGSAQAIDGEKALSCEITGASQCDDAVCTGVEVSLIQVPSSWKIDFAELVVASTVDARTSPISGIQLLEEAVVVQGHQTGRGWTMVIDRGTGHLSVSVADVQGAFVLAGTCKEG